MSLCMLFTIKNNIARCIYCKGSHNFHYGKFYTLRLFHQKDKLSCMSSEKNHSKPILFIREICKGRTEEELQEAERNFREYLIVVKEICDRKERNESEET